MPTRKRRQWQDIFQEVLTGFAVATVGAIITGTQGTVTISVPGVVPGDIMVEGGAAGTYLGAVSIDGAVSANDTVTLFLQNNSGTTVTPPASTTYFAVCGKVNPEVYTA